MGHGPCAERALVAEQPVVEQRSLGTDAEAEIPAARAASLFDRLEEHCIKRSHLTSRVGRSEILGVVDARGTEYDRAGDRPSCQPSDPAAHVLRKELAELTDLC